MREKNNSDAHEAELKEAYEAIKAMIAEAKKLSNDLECPAGLDDEGKTLWQNIHAWLVENEFTKTGGCKAFASPEQWANRGEKYGLNSQLIIIHDGGDLAKLCNPDYEEYELMDKFQKFIDSLGYYLEGCTSWYSAIYK
jgi:hypothetical protein